MAGFISHVVKDDSFHRRLEVEQSKLTALSHIHMRTHPRTYVSIIAHMLKHPRTHDTLVAHVTHPHSHAHNMLKIKGHPRAHVISHKL